MPCRRDANSIERNPSRETNTLSVDQEIPQILIDQNVAAVPTTAQQFPYPGQDESNPRIAKLHFRTRCYVQLIIRGDT
jgi:hypothetical protein